MVGHSRTALAEQHQGKAHAPTQIVTASARSHYYDVCMSCRGRLHTYEQQQHEENPLDGLYLERSAAVLQSKLNIQQRCSTMHVLLPIQPATEG